MQTDCIIYTIVLSHLSSCHMKQVAVIRQNRSKLNRVTEKNILMQQPEAMRHKVCQLFNRIIQQTSRIFVSNMRFSHLGNVARTHHRLKRNGRFHIPLVAENHDSRDRNQVVRSQYCQFLKFLYELRSKTPLVCIVNRSREKTESDYPIVVFLLVSDRN